MSRATLSATTTVTQHVEVSIDQRVRAMLKARCTEHGQLATQIKDAQARQKRLQTEVEDLFVKAGQQGALADGTRIDGYKVKKVCGKSKKLDKLALMTAIGLDAAELDAFFDERDNKPYIRISAPGDKEDDHE